MPGQAAKITVTERQHNILLSLRNATTAPSHLRHRAAVILLAFDGLRNEDIAAEVGLGRRQVGRWRRRWAKAWSGLIDLECRETKADLRRAIEAVLTDAPRPGAPEKWTKSMPDSLETSAKRNGLDSVCLLSVTGAETTVMRSPSIVDTTLAWDLL